MRPGRVIDPEASASERTYATFIHLSLLLAHAAIPVIPALILPWALVPLRSPILFALLPMAPLAWVYTKAIREGRARDAAFLAIAWAAALTIATVAVTARSPQGAFQTIWHAGGFRDEMVRWIATGRGPEGKIALFLPRVLAEYALVWILSALSRSARPKAGQFRFKLGSAARFLSRFSPDSLKPWAGSRCDRRPLLEFVR